jgi:hypothetical protein
LKETLRGFDSKLEMLEIFTSKFKSMKQRSTILRAPSAVFAEMDHILQHFPAAIIKNQPLEVRPFHQNRQRIVVPQGKIIIPLSLGAALQFSKNAQPVFQMDLK